MQVSVRSVAHPPAPYCTEGGLGQKQSTAAACDPSEVMHRGGAELELRVSGLEFRASGIRASKVSA